MRWPAFAAAAVTIATAGGAVAQDGPYRRFTQPPIDPNRNNRMIYAPVASAYPGSRPADQPHDVSAATWFQQSLGSRAARPDKVLDGGSYVLERFTTIGNGDNPMFEVVVTRTPAPPAGTALPALRVVHPDSAISAAALPTMTQASGSATYRFLVRPPLAGFTPVASAPGGQNASRYELRFLPAGEVRNPVWMRQAGTFAGAGVEARMSQAPPQLPVEERVAGRRLEFRSAQSAPVVTYDEKVAGRRQEQRNRR
ncbi:MAG: hypothetical protein K0Q72_2676 [Armatimonadetes bacterium]|jgi:hypothetical protein|nr:hypothetical protein [Armatimonadota bacterium]